MEPTQGRFKVEKFYGSGDFGIWKHKMLCALEILGLDSVLEGKAESGDASEKIESDAEEKVEEKVDPTKAMKDKRVRSLIQMSLSDQIIRKVMRLQLLAYGKHWKGITKLSLFLIGSILSKDSQAT